MRPFLPDSFGMLGMIMTLTRWFLLIALMAAPAQAAEVLYPLGSRIGLVPPPGLTVSQSFSGFEDRDNRVAVVTVVLPAAAYPNIEKSTTPEALQKQGVTQTRRCAPRCRVWRYARRCPSTSN
jgi:hypothetical protein